MFKDPTAARLAQYRCPPRRRCCHARRAPSNAVPCCPLLLQLPLAESILEGVAYFSKASRLLRKVARSTGLMDPNGGWVGGCAGLVGWVLPLPRLLPDSKHRPVEACNCCAVRHGSQGWSQRLSVPAALTPCLPRFRSASTQIPTSCLSHLVKLIYKG